MSNLLPHAVNPCIAPIFQYKSVCKILMEFLMQKLEWFDMDYFSV